MISILFFTACEDDKEKKEPKSEEETIKTSFTYNNITPVDFPSLAIPGFNFPEDSTLLNQWITENDSLNIYSHAWGIWTGITSPTNQKVANKTLLVFETWLTPEEMLDSINGTPIKRSNRANLKKPHQFTHFAPTVNDSIHESVSYSPAAASFAIENKLFLATTLYDYAQQGLNDIPNFPDEAITIKPVFKVLPVSTSGGQHKFAISSWHGPIDSLAGFPENDWHSCIYVDVENQSNGDGSQLYYENKESIPAPTPATSYNLNDFIHYTMNAEDAYFFNKEFSENSENPMKAHAGDIVILVGMHVSTKENKRWTWQTFWWAPDADNPPLPSSKVIADQRPDILTGPAAHYAMAVAYYMIKPDEPYNGRNIKGKPNFAFNPYLEAGFTPSVFDKNMSMINTETGLTISTYAGVRTNCMSCHSMATVNPKGFTTGSISTTPYIGNAYISLDDPIFESLLKVDFAWSVEGNIDTTGIKEHINNYQKE